MDSNCGLREFSAKTGPIPLNLLSPPGSYHPKVLVEGVFDTHLKAVQEAGTTGSNPVRESLLPGDDRSIVGDTYMVRRVGRPSPTWASRTRGPVVDGVAGEKTMVFFL